MKFLKQEKTKSKLPLVIGILAMCLLCLLLVFAKAANGDASLREIDDQIKQEETQSTEPTVTEPVNPMPWDEAGAKQPGDYIWEEYDALTREQKLAFQAHLGSDAYTAWLDGMRKYADIQPWDEPGAKLPDAYTWEEYEALSSAQQIAFQSYLGEDTFSAWLSSVQQEAAPWDEAGAKQPEDYTWEEFEALSAAQQMLFQHNLRADGFDKWLNQVQNQSEPHPWEVSSAKQPEDYTWEEFEALTDAQQMAFQSCLGTDGFDAWLSRVQSQDAAYPWERTGAKQPGDYSWWEFEALTAAQQMAFQNYLGEDAFETWLIRVQSQDATIPWEKPGAKQPEDYSWWEFEALTGSQQMAFQSYLGADGFEAWLNKNGNP